MWLCGVIGMNTKGIPSPSVENAMFTPPAVFAYWMRGSIAALSYSTAGGTRRGRMTRKWLLPLSQVCRCRYNLPSYT